jgi:hypothetical protein
MNIAHYVLACLGLLFVIMVVMVLVDIFQDIWQ